MKKQIRQSVFETNSSSTHVISMCLTGDYKNWTDGKVLYNENENEFLPVKEAVDKNIEILKREWPGKILDVDYELYRKGDITLQELATRSSERIWKGDLREWCYLTDEEFGESYKCLEDFANSFTTPSGESVTAWGYYGYEC